MICATYASALVGTLSATRIRFELDPVPLDPPQAASRAVAPRLAATRLRRVAVTAFKTPPAYSILRTVTASPRHAADRYPDPETVTALRWPPAPRRRTIARRGLCSDGA